MAGLDAAASGTAARGIDLLLVEDDAVSAEVLREQLLESWPCANVHREVSLDGAIAQVRSKRWDVVLLDLGLPQCRGLQALQRLRNHDRTAPIVVITANDDRELAAEALEEEAQDYLTTGEVDAPTLSRAIRYAMGRQQILVRMHDLILDARAQERNLFELLRRSADGVLVFDRNARVCFVNEAAEPMFGKPACQLLGEPLSGIDLSKERADIEWRVEGTTRFLDVRVVALDWQGQPSKLVLVRDQTDRRRAEELRAQLQRSERLAAIGQLAAGIAHEINNPLTYVMGSLDILRRELTRLSGEGIDVERMQGLCEGAVEGTERVAGIVRDLSVFSRRDREEGARPTDLEQAIEAALKMVHPQLQHRARVVRELSGVGLVAGQPGRLTQVFVNLLVNAAHAIEEGRVEENRIVVRTWQREGLVYAAVGDSGCGVAEDVLPHLFEPFFTTKNAGEGTGLGLYVCRSIVDSYGGDMEISSKPGEGTRVQLHLPAWQGDSQGRERPISSRPPHAEGRAARVLVVDDEVRIRALLVDQLAPQHDVVTAESGREARMLLERDPRFDMILCDVVMDDMSGLELEAWIVEHAPQLAPRLLFMSGGGTAERSAEEARRLEGRMIEKPFRDREVLRRLDALMQDDPDHDAG